LLETAAGTLLAPQAKILKNMYFFEEKMVIFWLFEKKSKSDPPL